MWYGVQNMSKYDIDIKVQPLKVYERTKHAVFIVLSVTRNCKLFLLPRFSHMNTIHRGFFYPKQNLLRLPLIFDIEAFQYPDQC